MLGATQLFFIGDLFPSLLSTFCSPISGNTFFLQKRLQFILKNHHWPLIDRNELTMNVLISFRPHSSGSLYFWHHWHAKLRVSILQPWLSLLGLGVVRDYSSLCVPYVVLEIELVSAECKTSTLSLYYSSPSMASFNCFHPIIDHIWKEKTNLWGLGVYSTVG